MTELTEDELLDQLASWLKEEGLDGLRAVGWGRDGENAVLAWREDWPTIVSISVKTPENLPGMICFSLTVLEGVGSEPGGKYPEDQDKLKEIEKQAVDRVDLLNADQLIGRWVFRHQMSKITLEHEMLADDLTKAQLVGTVEILGRDSSIWESLRGELGGISGLQGMKEAAELVEKIEKARKRSTPPR